MANNAFLIGIVARQQETVIFSSAVYRHLMVLRISAAQHRILPVGAFASQQPVARILLVGVFVVLVQFLIEGSPFVGVEEV